METGTTNVFAPTLTVLIPKAISAQRTFVFPPELLEIVLDYTDQPSLVALALVSLQWNEAATRRLYRRIPYVSGMRLARLVSCLTTAWEARVPWVIDSYPPLLQPQQRTTHIDFSGTIGPLALSRLAFPGCYIRHLDCTQPSSLHPSYNMLDCTHYRCFMHGSVDAPDNALLLQLMTLLSYQSGCGTTATLSTAGDTGKVTWNASSNMDICPRSIVSLRIGHGFLRDFVVRQMLTVCSASLQRLYIKGMDAFICDALQRMSALTEIRVILDDSNLDVQQSNADATTTTTTTTTATTSDSTTVTTTLSTIATATTTNVNNAQIDHPTSVPLLPIVFATLTGIAVMPPSLHTLVIRTPTHSQQIPRVTLHLATTTLTHLELANIHVHSEQLFELIRACSKTLVHVRLEAITVGTSLDVPLRLYSCNLLNLLSSITGLQSLVLKCPAALGSLDPPIESLSPLSYTVASLDIECISISSHVLEHWISNCCGALLTHLRIADCRSSRLSTAQEHYMHVVDSTNSPSIDTNTDSLAHLASKCTQLTSLVLQGQFIHDIAVDTFVQSNPLLTRLSLVDLPHITDTLLESWMGRLRPSTATLFLPSHTLSVLSRLSHIDLMRCPALTYPRISHFITQLHSFYKVLTSAVIVTLNRGPLLSSSSLLLSSESAVNDIGSTENLQQSESDRYLGEMGLISETESCSVHINWSTVSVLTA
ncbi:hypothetical protein BASA62_000019 [Batrachochytrium salamandrivorans]|nr:hypothetical protein BASA62_000019 [Batrachochytrium salamandrivorans]